MLLLLALFCLPVNSQASDLSANVDRNKIGIDETLNLRVRYSGDENGGQPDFELLEQDFDILSRQQSNQYRVINGRAESFVEWILTLAPKREGELFIPSLHFKGQVSDAIPIKVSEAGSAPDGAKRKAFMEIELDKDEVFVQEQLLVKVRLYTTIGLHDIATEPLQVAGAHVEKVDEQRYERKLDGVSHAVYELTYAVFPDSSGQLSIPALTYVAVAGRRDPFSLFNRNSQRLRLRSQGKTIEVLPKPDSYSGAHWLPAASLGIVQTWSQDPDTFAVGEPITRILTIRAEGLRAAQLPPLPKLDLQGLKTYPDQPQQEDQVGPNGVTGSRIETTAIVATQPGDYQLPAITLTWWDTKNKKQRTTQLPAFRFKVSGTAATTPPSQESGNLPTLATPSTINLEKQGHFWRNLAIAAIASHLLWILYFYRLNQKRTKLQTTNPNSEKKEQHEGKLKKAIESEDPIHIQQALLEWLQQRWPQARGNNLSEMSHQLGFEELVELQSLLSAAIYQEPIKPLNTEKLKILIRQLMERNSDLNTASEQGELPKLFT
ncbi:BatD family protein [uncultured Microbulbifer sp.]|uniref:BatD family protein n=1 Tax=uncultured Microbulbifer sp. TaxID=348147 RepID=UPI0026247945|nr:BatD family protein [uncultured Microbulbifer sp.]